MLVHDFLFDPIVKTREMRTEEFTKYVDINDQPHTKSISSDVDKVHEIREKFYASHQGLPYQNYLDDIWDKVFLAFNNNPGLVQFTLDYHGAESLYFLPWLIEIATSPSGALEMAYGIGNDLASAWTEHIEDTDDPIVDFIHNDPTFVYNRERELCMADLVTTVQEKSTPDHPSKVIDLGAGRMAWARHHGFKFDPEVQHIYAYEHDMTINAKKLFDKSLDELGITYEFRNALAQIQKATTCRDSDLIMLGGVASYYPFDEVFVKTVIAPSHGLLNPGGAFFFDLQLDCPYLRRSMSIFNWPEMQLKSTAAEAIDTVETMRKKLWQSGCKFGAEYRVDTYNEAPTSVLVILTKI